jgi:AraC family transcriptional regulator, regulatory protein of adaptative response / methylated-DNA-[protein]-cysteine methyltransferase
MKRSNYSTDDARWQAVLARDPQARDAFVYGVLTTGIYCRPGCASRRPNRANVRFFDSWQAAEAAGLRPCKRCQPQAADQPDPTTAAVVQACALIDAAESPPSLNELAAAVGLSPAHFHRQFRRIVGITPKQYAAEKQRGRARELIQSGGSVTEAIYQAGFDSSSPFYQQSRPALGMKPATYRNGGPGQTIRFAVVQSYLGWVLVAATDQGLCRIDIAETPDPLPGRLHDRFPAAELVANDPDFDRLVARVLAFLERPEQGLELPLDIQGTAFQQQVWTALRTIPAGSTASYSDIAQRIGRPGAARAVAQACAANPIAVAIPCHRVVRGDGGLGGYRWGIDRKQALLQREGA